MAQIADQPSGGCIYHFEPTRAPQLHILFLVGEKGFSVQTPEINWFYIIGKKDSLRTRVLEREFLKRAFWTPKRTEPTC